MSKYWLDAVVGAIVLYFIYDLVVNYRATAGSVWHKLVASAEGSATILWARFTVIVTAATGCLVQVANFINAPSVASAITTYLTPSTVAAIMVATAVITEWARRRTLDTTG